MAPCSAGETMILGVYEVHGPGDGEISTGIEEMSWDTIRAIRNGFLSKSDRAVSTPDRWTDAELEELLVYRVALRDLPETYPDAHDAQRNFPDEPDFMVGF